MAIRFVSKATVKNKLVRSSNVWDGTAVYNPFTLVGNYDALATVTVGAGGVASITFAGIPTTGYSHLQMRIMAVTNTTAQSATTTFNGSNGRTHWLTGNGSTTQAAGDGTKIYFPLTQGSTTAPVVGVMDILDYANTNKFKTTRTLEGYDANGSGNVSLTSGLWQSTSAINSITITAVGTFNQYSQFALYGVKA
jgi:hypothetical protein